MEEKKKVEYPRVWEYCVMGSDKEKLHNAIEEVMPNHQGIKDSKSTKKYHSKKVKHLVNSQEERDELFKRLKDHPEIVYIL